MSNQQDYHGSGRCYTVNILGTNRKDQEGVGQRLVEGQTPLGGHLGRLHRGQTAQEVSWGDRIDRGRGPEGSLPVEELT